MASLGKVNILMVDDRPEGLIALEAVLRSPEFNLVHAHSGEEALYHYDRDDFAVILLDVQMPGMDGFETARHMRLRKDKDIVPIIFITAISKEEYYVFKGYEVGAVDYLFKPFNPDILRSKVTVFVELFRRNVEIKRQAELLRQSDVRERERQLLDMEITSLRRYQHLADAVPHIVWHSGADGRINYFNKFWTSYSGLGLNESCGNGWLNLMVAEDRTEFCKAWDKARLTGFEFEAECRIRGCSDATDRWHLLRCVPERDESGCVVGWVGTTTDIHARKTAETEQARLFALEQAARVKAQTAQKNLEHALSAREQAECEMRKAKEAADAANRAKSELLANMSHEIRTPLGVVLGFSELMADPNLPTSERFDLLKSIKRNGRQLCKLIDEILDLSKVEAGKLEIEAINFSLVKLLRDVTTSLSFQARRKNIDFVTTLDTPIPRIINSDPTRLRQILMNIIGNSIKFTESGSIEIKISLVDDAKDEDGNLAPQLRFLVKDTGVGIDEGKHSKLFQAFMQADGSTTRRFGGTGLGLILSRRLAKRLGGDVTLVESELGQGSTFCITLATGPLAGAAMADDLGIAERSIDGLPSKGPEEYSLIGISVLLAEDFIDNQMLIKQILVGVGARVEVADNGNDVVRMAQEYEFDIILMDIQMPEMDGYQATAMLRSQGYCKPILALTAHAMKNEGRRCIEAGCDAHLTKPIDRKILIETIAFHVGLKEQTSAPVANRTPFEPPRQGEL